MKNINLAAKNIFFIGIGGVSMSGLAHILHKAGFVVCGSDREAGPQTRELEAVGVEVFYGHRQGNVPLGTELVVYTAAIKEDNPEYRFALDNGIEVISRAQLLGMFTRGYRHSVCVAGTHGKTTTTAMIGYLIKELDPTVSVGAVVDYIGGNFRLGASEYFVVESCEYNDSFLEFSPDIGVVLNLEYDHPDHFKDMAQLERSFEVFAKNTRSVLVINKNIGCFDRLVAATSARVVAFGDYGDGRWGHVVLPTIGYHNAQNAYAALTVADILGVQITASSFKGYKNPRRRLEHKGKTKNGAIVIDDYAHHPTEIRYTLQALHYTYPQKKINCLFQPHTYSRTIGLLNDFATAFELADSVLLLDIYAAREKNTGQIHSKDLQRSIKKPQTLYFESYEQAQIFLNKNLTSNDLLITMGATNVYLIGEELLG